MYNKLEKEAHTAEVDALLEKIDEEGEKLLARATALMERENYAGAARVYSDIASIFGASTIGETARAGADTARQAMYTAGREASAAAQVQQEAVAPEPLQQEAAPAPPKRKTVALSKAEQEALAKVEFDALLAMIREEVKRTRAASGANGTIKVDAASVISGMTGTTREEAMAKIELILDCYPDTSYGKRVRKLKEKL